LKVEATPLLSRIFQEMLDTSHAEAFGVEHALSSQAHAIFARSHELGSFFVRGLV